MSHGDRYLRYLCILLAGYAFLGKGFAYIGVAPLYVGELTMAYGLFALAMQENWSRVLRTFWLWPLFALMGWGALRTIPYLSADGVDALHDAAMWIWGLFAITLSSLIAAEPDRLRFLESRFIVYAKWLLVIAPVAFWLTSIADTDLPMAFWANVPYVVVKGGDLIVQLTGIFAFVTLLGGLNLTYMACAMIVNLAMYFTGRASMVTFLSGAAVVTAVRPRSRVPWTVLTALVLAVGVMWAFDIHFGTAARQAGRDISADQMIENVQSIFGDSKEDTLSGSKAWRLAWWDTILDYTLHGKYFWKGKGFGVNLADDDGFQVEADHSLRNPHNGHLTMLARGGVPMLGLWIICQLTCAAGLLKSAYLAHRRGQRHWFGWHVFLLVYWMAFLINASFDVFLESPVGGIWFWCVYGVAIGSIWVYQHRPETLSDEDLPLAAASAKARFDLADKPIAVCAS